MGGCTNLDFHFGDRKHETPHPAPRPTLPPVLLGGPALTLCGGRGPTRVVRMLALPGGCLLPDTEAQGRGGHLPPPGLAQASCCLRGGPRPRPSPRPRTLAHPCPSLSSRRLHIALPVLLDPSLVDNHQPLFAAASFLTLPGLPKTRLRFWC